MRAKPYELIDAGEFFHLSLKIGSSLKVAANSSGVAAADLGFP
jgi:hypothetical protein